MIRPHHHYQRKCVPSNGTSPNRNRKTRARSNPSVVLVIPRRPKTKEDAKSMVGSLNQAAKETAATAAAATKLLAVIASAATTTTTTTAQTACPPFCFIPNTIFSGRSGRKVHVPLFRVLLVDDSKPYRIKLQAMIQPLFENIIIEGCASPKEGLNKVTQAALINKPIHIVIVDQIFLGSNQTGSEMCNCLGRQNTRINGESLLPCVLISDYLEINASTRNDSNTLCTVGNKGNGKRTAIRSNNIVERCNKTEITKEVIFNWFMKYVNGCNNGRRSSERRLKRVGG